MVLDDMKCLRPGFFSSSSYFGNYGNQKRSSIERRCAYHHLHEVGFSSTLNFTNVMCEARGQGLHFYTISMLLVYFCPNNSIVLL